MIFHFSYISVVMSRVDLSEKIFKPVNFVRKISSMVYPKPFVSY